jgi:hypothetical protein
MEAEAVLVGAGGALLLRVGGDQGGVEVEGDVLGADPVLPGVAPRLGPGSAHRGEVEIGAERVDHPPGGGDRGHLAEEVRLVVQDGQVGEAVSAIGDADGEVPQHLAGVVRPPTPLQAGELPRERRGQPHPIGQLDQQVAARVRDHPLAIRRHHRPWPLGSLHPESAPLFGIFERREPEYPLSGGALSRSRPRQPPTSVKDWGEWQGGHLLAACRRPLAVPFPDSRQ